MLNRSIAEHVLTFRAQLRSDAYRAYSVWGANSGAAGRIAISENPLAILDHVNSTDVNLAWHQDQSSAAQVEVQSYQFHAHMGVRKSAATLFNEFGSICNVNLWLADCGMVNFRTYQDSAGATVNRTLTPDDYVQGTFTITENPISQDLASDFTVRYGYQYHLVNFDNSLRAARANNALCNSLDAAGIRNAISIGTEYVMNTDTASYWLGNLVRRFAQGQSLAQVTLPFRHCDLELYDVIRMQHPVIVGSASTFQILQLAMHPIEGWVSITAQELR